MGGEAAKRRRPVHDEVRYGVALWPVLFKRLAQTFFAGVPVPTERIVKVEIDRPNFVESALWSLGIYQSPIA